MSSTKQIAKHFRDVYFGGNWTAVNLKDTLADVTLQQATTKVHNLNTIATLVFHINYYVNPVLKVLQGQPIVASDKLSFNLPPITSDEEWKKLVTKALTEAAELADWMEELDDAKLQDVFANSKYGNYYRNLLGIIEHTHYHLGQISLIKKIIQESGKAL
ncbi:MAG: DinB family protein [Bacteroidia bacterium]|nr:DinB family protein [Bacteroidia bacterium]MBP7260082.1 DinB family protein [Bacteroidia bacterium]MBP9179171.1 DinB family protein [Bacteroidia bacterium]MBP9723620.1 DinB family protein [Bacteroidia bacterium]